MLDSCNPHSCLHVAVSAATKGRHMVDVLDALGVRCTVVGNHDFGTCATRSPHPHMATQSSIIISSSHTPTSLLTGRAQTSAWTRWRTARCAQASRGCSPTAWTSRRSRRAPSATAASRTSSTGTASGCAAPRCSPLLSSLSSPLASHLTPCALRVLRVRVRVDVCRVRLCVRNRSLSLIG